jgi:phosphoglycolate phosphatase
VLEKNILKKHVIFDLDGTLIDSSTSILQSFEAAFKKLDIPNQKPFTQEIIGPPLMPTLKSLSGSDDASLLDGLAQAFKDEYDGHAYRAATVFNGIASFLKRLHENGVQMYIATNKRILPTSKIMQHLQWQQYFTGVYALDYFTPPVASKKDMVTQILSKHALALPETLFVGDRIEDGLAAEGNGLDFAMVTWGYLDDSQGDIAAHWLSFSSPTALADYVLGTPAGKT